MCPAVKDVERCLGCAPGSIDEDQDLIGIEDSQIIKNPIEEHINNLISMQVGTTVNPNLSMHTCANLDLALWHLKERQP